MWSKETDEEFYRRNRAGEQQHLSADHDDSWLGFYPRHDPTSPRRYRIDTQWEWLPYVVGIAASLVITPFGGIALAWLTSVALKNYHERANARADEREAAAVRAAMKD